MPSAHLPAEVTVRYWAGARAAAGIESERVAAGTVGEVIEQLRDRHTGLGPVLAVASFLVDGVARDRNADVPAGSTLEVLPPFAGG
jgi:molybdopterin synthase sulfur carrier subunit